MVSYQASLNEDTGTPMPDIDWLRQASIENALRCADLNCEALESLLTGDSVEVGMS